MFSFFPFFVQTLVTFIGVVWGIEAMCVDWKTMRRPSENGRSHQMPSVTESVDDVEMVCLWIFMVFMVETLGFSPMKHTIETAAETPGVLCTTFDGRMQLWDIGWSLGSWIEIDYGD